MLIFVIIKLDTYNNIQWPENLIYGTKKNYIMNKKYDIIKYKTKVINYYCINHRYKSKIIKDPKKCCSKIIYERDEDEFYLFVNNSAECQKNNIFTKEEIKTIHLIHINYQI